MWSDKVELPATIDKAAADEAEIAIAQQQSQPQARGLAALRRVRRFGRRLIRSVVLLERYIQGSQFGWMLLPTEGQALNPDGQGYRQRFMAGLFIGILLLVRMRLIITVRRCGSVMVGSLGGWGIPLVVKSQYQDPIQLMAS
nr:hypothetical protein [Corynebacterium glutamicum]